MDSATRSCEELSDDNVWLDLPQIPDIPNQRANSMNMDTIQKQKNPIVDQKSNVTCEYMENASISSCCNVETPKKDQSREALRKKKEKVEGVQYLPNYGINQDFNSSNTVDFVSLNESKMVFFDLETSGLNATADILQIAAKSGDYIFNVYIERLQEISASATKITGLHSIDGKLYYHSKLLETCTQENALQAFNLFLKKLATHCLLVAHNASFDRPRLLRLILKHGMIEPFYIISGFSDSLAVLKKALPDRKGPGKFKLSTLYNDFLTTDNVGDSDKMFHNAEFDVVALEKLVHHLQIEDKLFLHAKTLQISLIELEKNNKMDISLQELSSFKNIISRNVLKKIAIAGFTSDSLIEIYKSAGKAKIIELLSEKVDGKARVTKDKKVLNKIIHHIISLL
ncbi:hypothetical protein ALC62_15322 [Cyphomyrmex costatus]|uniref:Exonuclease domain-containing protein n=1 Tax=Cyphomyrmex costatus TaxID=456900 RepID=A0A151I7F8_9HYME|nr:hypothetical protein ALC62_15322 [Cyphomyrmex costatus]